MSWIEKTIPLYHHVMKFTFKKYKMKRDNKNRNRHLFFISSKNKCIHSNRKESIVVKKKGINVEFD